MGFLNNIYHGVLNFPWEGFYYTVRTVIIILDIILFIGFIFALWKALKYRPDLVGSFKRKGGEAPKKRETVFDVARFEKHWKEIQDKSATAPPQSFTLAIVAADNLIGDALDALGLVGDSIADKLGKLNPRELKTLNNLWRAHRVRNDLVHTTSFEIKQSEAKEILNIYESFLKEIGALK
jgi:hypothetical protein